MLEQVKKRLGVYVHIPFCVQKCKYCDFLSAPVDEGTKQSYCEALIREIESYREKVFGYEVATVYFGGGTPSILKVEQIEKILYKLCDVFSMDHLEKLEITLEVNPGTVDKEKWLAYRRMGINRISIGLQSAQNRELELLGRIHSYEEFLVCFKEARQAGFANISVDVMSALPGQSLEIYQDTLQKVVALAPEHISSYSLIVEPGTVFWERYGQKQDELPSEEEDRSMYEYTQRLLEEHGYERYEISNYAKEGYESKHNSSYWERIPYIGVGLGASSFFEDKRYHNCSELARYIQYAEQEERMEEVELIGKREAMEEFMFLGLRKMKGIQKSEFLKCFQLGIEECYGDVIEKLVEQKLLYEDADRIWLSEYGIDVSNVVLSEFLLED